MRYNMYTVSREDIEGFKNDLPETVLTNCGKPGFFILGAADPENNLVGMTQFHIGMLPDGECVSDVVYVFVEEDSRGRGAASRMLSQVHAILKKSGVDKSMTVLGKKQSEKQLFTENGYIFMKPDKESIDFFKELHQEVSPMKSEQGIYWVNR